MRWNAWKMKPMWSLRNSEKFADRRVAASAEIDLASRWGVECSDQVQQARLATAAWADESQEFAFSDLDVDPIKGLGLAIVEMQCEIFDANNSIGVRALDSRSRETVSLREALLDDHRVSGRKQGCSLLRLAPA